MKRRYIVAIAIVLVSVLLTPSAIRYAYIERGGVQAFGGEYMIIPFGIILAAFVLSIAADIDRARRKVDGSAVHEVRTDSQEPAVGGDEHREDMR